MAMEPVIFISAVSKELRSARQLVANTLKLLGYEQDWQDIFGMEQGDLRGMLRRRIDASAGVVQLIGQCYGAEPPTPDEQFGRVSYTQYEALYAKQRGKKVWYLILDANFSGDPCEAEPEELRALQAAYREKIRAGGQLYKSLSSADALEAQVLKLRNQLRELRRWSKLIATGVVALLVVIAGLVIWQIESGRVSDAARQRSDAENKQKLDKLTQQMALLTQVVNAQTKQRDAGQKGEQIEERAYADVAKANGKSVEAVKETVKNASEQVKNSPDATTYDRAVAAYLTKDYAEAERLGLQAAKDAQDADPPRLDQAVRALELSGWSAQNQIHFAVARDHFRAAAELTDRNRDPSEWAQVQHELASALDFNGEYAESERILREVIDLYTKLHSPEDELTVGARFTLAAVLDHTGTIDKCKEAAEEERALIEIDERRFGQDNPDSLTLHNNRGLALYCAGDFAEAEKEERYAYTNERRVLGPQKEVTLFSLNNLAMALDAQGKYPEAEKDFRLALTLKEQCPELGRDSQERAENPYTLFTVYYLAICLQHQGKLDEAKQFAERTATVAEKKLGPNHPDTIKYQKLYEELSGKHSTD
jgi:tetratricopeptide (TPR) repeat protein